MVGEAPVAHGGGGPVRNSAGPTRAVAQAICPMVRNSGDRSWLDRSRTGVAKSCAKETRRGIALLLVQPEVHSGFQLQILILRRGF